MTFTTARRAFAAGAVALAAAFGAAQADETAELVIDGEQLVTRLPAPEDHPLTEIRSGWTYRSAATQELQTDDFDNPGFVFVELGEELWSTVDGSENKACASCHEDVSESMAGVRAGMPKWNEEAGKPRSLQHYVNGCRTERMGAEAWKWDSQEMLSMTALIGLQSRGMPVDVQTDGPMQAWWEQGKEIYYTRVGQLDLACSNCHEDNHGMMIRADHLSQGQVNGFPVYRLKWQGLGSIHRRFKGCMKNIRATPYKVGSDEFTALELYVASRGEGLSVETPSVRN